VAGQRGGLTLWPDEAMAGRFPNIAGRLVRTICAARECEAGTNRLIWNAQTDDGLAVPDGVYLLQVKARTAEGTESRALASVRLER